jgi:cell wall-associated NlpC family hydrolase
MLPLPAGVADNELLAIAAGHIGTPYRFGGTSASGMDCSGFTRSVFSAVGLDLPHSAREQFTMGASIAKYELQPGDLVFFRTYRRGASHVGIYLGDTIFVHAASRGGIVRVDTLDEPYYRARYLGARRMIDSDS